MSRPDIQYSCLEIEVEQVLPNDRPFVPSERDLAQDESDPTVTDRAIVEEEPELAVDVKYSPAEIIISDSEVLEPDTVDFEESALQPVDPPPMFDQETEPVDTTDMVL